MPETDKIYPLIEDDKQKLESSIQKALDLLKPTNSNPEEIVTSLETYIKQNNPTKVDKENLEKLFGQQLVNKAGWSWYIHEVKEEILDFRDLVVISPDQKYEWHPYGGMPENCLEEFNNILDIEDFKRRKIKYSLNRKRQQSDEYKNMNDDELIKALEKENIKYWRENINFIETFKDYTDEEILKEKRAEIDKYIYGHLLPYKVHLVKDRISE